MDRRDFVVLATAAPLAAAGPAFFSTANAAWIDALMARIIPTDDAPGAREANCLNYLDHQLNGPLARFAPDYQRGLAEFQKAHPTFLELDPTAQDAILTTRNGDPFFEMLIDHTMQAFYGSPAHGGNKDEASWNMLGIARHMGGGHWHGA